MKRISLLIMSALMLFSTLCTNVYASSAYETELLSALSIMQGDPNGNMRYADKVSRAECAKIVVVASEYRNSVDMNSKSSPFKDVRFDHWAAPYVTTGIKNGLFKGYFDATFRPGNTVLYEEAITMLLRVLSYTEEDTGNDWPYDQIEMAKKIGMLDGVNKSIGQELTRRDISKLVYNTLNASAKGVQETYLSTFNRILGPKTVLSSSWYEEFGADSSIRVMRDGTEVSVSDVKHNDIAYFMVEYNTALVYSKKVTGIYETATPNKDAPVSVTVSGIKYNLEGDEAYSKLSSGGSFSYGDTVTLLLGKSGDVADVVTSSELSDIVYGFLIDTGTKETTVSGSTVIRQFVKVVLPSGKTCEYITNKDYSSIKNNTVAVNLKDSIATISLKSTSEGISGNFIWNNNTKKIGSTLIAEDVEILEVSTTESHETASTATVFPQRLNGVVLSDKNILYASRDSSGRINSLILTDTTGDMHSYGIITKASSSVNSTPITGSYEYILNGSSYTLSTRGKAFSVSSGQAVKITQDEGVVSSITALDKVASNKITDVTASYITVGGKNYTLSDKIQIYLKEAYNYTMVTIDELPDLIDTHQAYVYTDMHNLSTSRVRIIILS